MAEAQRLWRIALAPLAQPDTIAHGVAKMASAVEECARRGVSIVCFPETYIPGLRGGRLEMPAPNQPQMQWALEQMQAVCRRGNVAAIVGMEWIGERGLENRAFVLDRSGAVLGYQTKNQITPGGEEENYVPDGKRSLFAVDGVTFGIVICHEGWRYPETVRWAAVRGAQVIFQPQQTVGDRNGQPLETWGQSFYEKAMVCRAQENSVYFASVNRATPDQNSATSLIDPKGNLVAYVPYGAEELLVADLDLSLATRFYATRYHPEWYPG
ncbi:MAG: carbon-nitrogen hydrolase family protein [Anaerolineae bacterium]|nr:carbon-nitrogen hydrolase family protein [Anaerolineae bacterium]